MIKIRKEKIVLQNGEEEVNIKVDDLQLAVLVLRAINHNLRQRIIDLLEDAGEMTVTDIYVALRVEQSIASQHLSILRKAQIVDGRREGKYIHYSLNMDRMAYLAEVIDKLST